MSSAGKVDALVNAKAPMSIQVKQEHVDDERRSFITNTPDASILVENRGTRCRRTNSDELFDRDEPLDHENLTVNANESNHGSPTTDNLETESMITESFIDLENFIITVKGVNIASNLSQDIRKKYYELCLSRKLYLHEHLLETVKPSFGAELISETIEIVDAIQESGVYTNPDKFVIWDKTLESFELLGMDVGFVRSRLGELKQKKKEFECEIDNHIKNVKAIYDVMYKGAAKVAW